MTTTSQLTKLEKSIMNELVKDAAAEMMHKQVDDRGLPVFVVMEIENEHGELIKTYKRENYCNAEDYRKAAKYQANLADYHQILAAYYAAELQKLESAEDAFNDAF